MGYSCEKYCQTVFKWLEKQKGIDATRAYTFFNLIFENIPTVSRTIDFEQVRNKWMSNLKRSCRQLHWFIGYALNAVELVCSEFRENLHCHLATASIREQHFGFASTLLMPGEQKGHVYSDCFFCFDFMVLILSARQSRSKV